MKKNSTWIDEGLPYAVIYLHRSRRKEYENEWEQCLVDKEDLPRLLEHFWYWMNGYVHTTINSKTISLARVLLGSAPEGTRILYKNGQKLDCRKENILYSNKRGL